MIASLPGPPTIDSMTCSDHSSPHSDPALPACFELVRSWLAATDADALFRRLVDGVDWQHSGYLFGRPMPRLTAWFGSSSYSYSNTAHPPLPWPAELDALRSQLEQSTGARYNSCLANLYRHGRDSVGWHADDEPPLGDRPTIASLSLGATRDFNIKPRDGGGLVRLPLRHGDLLVMRDESQLDWRHSLPKRQKLTASRVNLTFRWFDTA